MIRCLISVRLRWARVRLFWGIGMGLDRPTKGGSWREVGAGGMRAGEGKVACVVLFSIALQKILVSKTNT